MSESCNWYNPACGLSWLAGELKAIVIWVYDGIMSGFASMIEAIPVPGFLENMGTVSMPPGVAYFATAFELPFGLTICVAAYTARFILRRIPGIG